jgi:hypothetical protein
MSDKDGEGSGGGLFKHSHARPENNTRNACQNYISEVEI